MTVTEKDLFLAILAMDSYNRGYDAGIKDGGDADPDGLGSLGSRIGNAIVSSESNTAENSSEVAAGFYAVAYQTQYGTVISYRGTDNLAVFGSGESGSDIYNGWVQGAGRYGGVE